MVGVKAGSIPDRWISCGVSQCTPPSLERATKTLL